MCLLSLKNAWTTYFAIHDVKLTSHTRSQALNDIYKQGVVVLGWGREYVSSIARFNSHGNLHICCVTLSLSHRSFSLSLSQKNTHSASKYDQKEVWDSGMNKVYIDPVPAITLIIHPTSTKLFRLNKPKPQQEYKYKQLQGIWIFSLSYSMVIRCTVDW